MTSCIQTQSQQIVSTLLSKTMNPANILKFLFHHSENGVCFHTLLTDAEIFFFFLIKALFIYTKVFPSHSLAWSVYFNCYLPLTFATAKHILRKPNQCMNTIHQALTRTVAVMTVMNSNFLSSVWLLDTTNSNPTKWHQNILWVVIISESRVIVTRCAAQKLQGELNFMHEF